MATAFDGVKEITDITRCTRTSLATCVALLCACGDRTPPRHAAVSVQGRPITSPRVCIDTAGEERALACAPPAVRRIKDTLSIQLTDGRVLRFVNTPPGETESGTMFRGTIGAGPLFILSDWGGERPPSYDMIDGRTGRGVGLLDMPLFSPDSTRFAMSLPDWMDCEIGRGGALGIWRLTDSLPVMEWQLRSWDCGTKPGWAADQLHWRGPDTLAFVQNEISEEGRTRGSKRTGYLVRAGSTWSLIVPTTPR